MVSDQIYSDGNRSDGGIRGRGDEGRRPRSIHVGGLSLWAHLVIWTIVAIAMIPPFFQLLDRQEPMAFVSASAVPDSGSPGAKVDVYYRGEYRRNDACAMSVLRSWIDSRETEWILAPIVVRYDRGFQTVGLTTNIPMNASVGPVTLKSTLEWSCNGLQAKFWPGRTDMPDVTVNVVR